MYVIKFNYNNFKLWFYLGYNVEKKSGDQKSVLRNSNNRQKNSRKNSYFSSSAQANSGSTLINFFLQIFILKFITSIKKNAWSY